MSIGEWHFGKLFPDESLPPKSENQGREVALVALRALGSRLFYPVLHNHAHGLSTAQIPNSSCNSARATVHPALCAKSRLMSVGSSSAASGALAAASRFFTVDQFVALA